MKSHNVCALAAIGVALAGPASAALSVRLDQNAIMDLRAPAGTVLIGDPAVVDVNLINPRRIAILGRGYGATNVIIIDRMGKVIFSQEVEVSRANTGRVSVYRGGSVSNFTCSPTCEPSSAAGAGSAADQAPAKDHAAPGGGAIAVPSQ
jgi:hypothetical protein